MKVAAIPVEAFTTRPPVWRRIRASYTARHRWRGDGGFDVVRRDTHVVGWLRRYNPELIEALQVLAGILSSPSALSWLLEAIRFRASLAGKP